ncbi:hypothetical protein BGZ82_004231, partial [Podila clonocystis]
RQQTAEQEYPSKRRQLQQQEEQRKLEEAKAKAAQEKKIQEQAKKLKEKKLHIDSDDEDMAGNYFLANPDLKTLVETLLGGRVESSKASTPAPVTKPASTPSSTHSSPELRATDILKRREQRQNEVANTIEGKHSQLNAIESTLKGLYRELEEIIASTVENKKQVLLTEENLTKAMFKIDAVESDGDLSIRKRRKELIKRSQNMLDLVDEFKSRDKNSCTSEDEAVSVPIEIESAEPETSVEPESEPEGTEATTASEEVELDLASLSDIESLPEVHEVPVESASVVESTESGKVQDDISPETSSEASQSDEEGAESDAEPGSSAEPDQEQGPATPTAEDPLDLIVDAALELAHPVLVDNDFELVSVH